MNDLETNVRSFLLDVLHKKIDSEDIEKLSMDGDIDLLATGILSSLGFISLISDIEDEFGIEIDFDNYDPSKFNTFTGLIDIASTAKKK